ncbi:unnamed protein product, partial [Prorocentrum cordatum]
AWGHLDGRDNWREGVMDSNPGVFLINVRAYFYAAWYLLSAVLYEASQWGGEFGCSRQGLGGLQDVANKFQYPVATYTTGNCVAVSDLGTYDDVTVAFTLTMTGDASNVGIASAYHTDSWTPGDLHIGIDTPDENGQSLFFNVKGNTYYSSDTGDRFNNYDIPLNTAVDIRLVYSKSGGTVELYVNGVLTETLAHNGAYSINFTGLGGLQDVANKFQNPAATYTTGNCVAVSDLGTYDDVTVAFTLTMTGDASNVGIASVYHTNSWTPGDLHIGIDAPDANGQSLYFAVLGNTYYSSDGDFRFNNYDIPLNTAVDIRLVYSKSGGTVELYVNGVLTETLAHNGAYSIKFTAAKIGAERFPGMTITYALIQMVEKVAERSDKARIITKAKVTKLLTANKACVGCVYEKGGAEFQEHGPVILATGGFGADFTSNSLLAQYRPDLMHLPTTNGEHCTGDGIKMGEAIGAKSVDLEWVQVHPTGLVKPDDPDAKIKFLAAEALRGVGGLVLDANGKRFANELGRRDYVTGEMWKNKPPFRLCLNKAASSEISWHCKHYTGRGVMKFYETGESLAKDMGVPLSVLEQTHAEHYQAAKKTEKDPDGGSYPAYPSGKSWDEASGKTGSGKKFYHNIIDGPAVKTEPFYVAIITPVIHYCMGGLEIDTDSACLDANGKAIPGLYAAGEVAGGVHGNNRLGGNSLLDCVVFGRVAGLAATKYMLGDGCKPVSLKDLSGGGLTGE